MGFYSQKTITILHAGWNRRLRLCCRPPFRYSFSGYVRLGGDSALKVARTKNQIPVSCIGSRLTGTDHGSGQITSTKRLANLSVNSIQPGSCRGNAVRNLAGMGFSAVSSLLGWRRSPGRQAISRPANGVRLNPFNSMAPGSVRKPLVTLFQ